MSRSFEAAYPDVALGALGVVLSPPGSHKFEVLGISPYSDLTNDYTWLFFIHHGADYVAVDSIVVPHTTSILHKEWEGLILYEGDELIAYVLTSGTAHIPFYVGYVDVDYTD